MYLSKLILNPQSRQVGTELRDPYQMHRTLCRGFDNAHFATPETQKALRMLFRVDSDKGALHVLVQSRAEPNWQSLEAHLLSREARYLLARPQVKEWDPTFEPGQRLRFRLVANPTYQPSAPRGSRSARKGLFTEHERLDWLRRQAENPERGFLFPELKEIVYRKHPLTKKLVHFRGEQLEELKLRVPMTHYVDLNDGQHFALPHKEPNATAAFSAARFDGILEVTDPTRFRTTVEEGIGKAKGFGFGLLSLARA